ncbi:MAG TPA: GNAT family N-acetyltransferase [Nocardioides sp.]|jgi:GNAT superfamily N-acetyltransferase|uniref:GNAT family N-acetyltransferase n=1 Tax=Nocardioides sp. TaxID=35761 RepID=UPI002E334795|nr:GNAT family N-acetyltransferase [Nocardioides sp.]HEX3930630.1 GNAT family N-acetyltransferase [Nocardioides sp.]
MPTDPSEVVVREALPGEWMAIADLYSEARRAAVPQMPPAIHTDEEHRGYYRRHVLEGDGHTVWVAESHGEIVGFAVCTPAFLDGLYVRPEVKGHGIGSLLLDVVDATHVDGYELWVFTSNEGARRLYERRGLVEVERTDGAGNEERSPDIRMAWRPPGRG